MKSLERVTPEGGRFISKRVAFIVQSVLPVATHSTARVFAHCIPFAASIHRAALLNYAVRSSVLPTALINCHCFFLLAMSLRSFGCASLLFVVCLHAGGEQADRLAQQKG